MYFPFQYATVFTLFASQITGTFSTEALFHSMFSQVLVTLPKDKSIPDFSTISRWGSAIRPVSDDFVEHCKNPNTRELIENDIREKLLTHLADTPKLIYQIIKLVREDSDYTAEPRAQLLGYNPSLENNHAWFLSTAILAAIKTNKCIRFDKELLLQHLYFPYKIPMAGRLNFIRPFFTGRTTELSDIETALLKERVVFLYGSRGIGKSALAAELAKTTTCFTNCVWMTYDQNLHQTIESIRLRGEYPNSTNLAPFEMNYKWLRSLDHDTLIILDNYDVLEETDPLFPMFIQNKFSLLVTSHVHHETFFEYELTEMNSSELLSLFKHYYTRDNLNDTQILEIISTAHNHTMVVEMTAKLMQNCPIKYKAILKELRKSVGTLSIPVNVLINKDGYSRNAVIKSHIGALYDLSKLNADQLFVLVCMSYMPTNGTRTDQFCLWCKDDFCNTITFLTRLGWLVRTPESDMLRIHPIVSEIMHEHYPQYKQELTDFIRTVATTLDLDSDSDENNLQAAISICGHHSDFGTTDWLVEILKITCYIHNKGLSRTSLDIVEHLLSSRGYRGCPHYIKTFLNYRAACLSISLNKYSDALIYLEKALSYDAGDDLYEPAYCSLLINCLLECALIHAIHNDIVTSNSFLDYAEQITQYLPDHECKIFQSRSLFKKGEILRLQNKHAEARTAFQETLEIRNSIYGESSIESAIAHSQIGLSYRKEHNDINSAIEFYKAYSILKHKVPELHPDLVSVQLSLGITLENITGKDLGIVYLLDYLAGASELMPSTKRTDIYINILQEMLDHPELLTALIGKSFDTSQVVQDSLLSTKELFSKFSNQALQAMRDEYGWKRDYAPRNIAPTFAYPYIDNKDEKINLELIKRLYDYHPNQSPLFELQHYVGDSAYSLRMRKKSGPVNIEGIEKPPIVPNIFWYEMLTAKEQ